MYQIEKIEKLLIWKIIFCLWVTLDSIKNTSIAMSYSNFTSNAENAQ